MKEIETGIMVEVPSAVLMADQMCDYIDFFSIGSNDLAQYILAADRFSQKENNLYDYYDPAVLRAINLVAEAAVKKREKKHLSAEKWLESLLE